MTFKFILLSGILFATAHFAVASPADEIKFRTDAFQSHPQSVQRQELQGFTFPQPIDHSVSSGPTFAQRYWIDSEFATSAASPVIFHICGEGPADQSYFLNDNAIAWAKSLNAHLVYLEHRYYGKSQPFTDLTTTHLQYLTLDNVLEDLATFQRWITQQQGWTGSWISVGGSYSGSLSAMYRQKHPELVVGALASSAPMVAGVGNSDDNGYDASQYTSTKISAEGGDRQWVYEACTAFGAWEAEAAAPGSTLYLPSASFCNQIFGNVNYINYSLYTQKYHDPFVAKTGNVPTNILFTYGTDDVWTDIGLTAQSNQNPNISIYMIEGAGHHEDLNLADDSDSEAIIQAREQFLVQAKKWLGL